MNRLPEVQMIEIFIRNRTMGGWSRSEIYAAIVQRTKWREIEYRKLNDTDRQRHDAISALLAQLQSGTPQE